MKTSIRKPNRISVLAAFCGLLMVAGAAVAQGKGKPPKAPPDTGLVYYVTLDGDTMSILADGSQQTLLIPGEWPGVAEPSRMLHGTPPCRWFLTSKPRPEGGTYPDGTDCVELFAISETGVERQLTNCGEYLQRIDNDPRFIWDTPLRWGRSSSFPLGDDTMVTWPGRHWHATGNPQDPWDYDFGIYAVEFQDVSTCPLRQIPTLRVSCTGSVVGNHGELPDIACFDWSPDGTRMVYQSGSGGGIYVADVPQQPGAQPVNPYCLINGSENPRWSPVGDLIMFMTGPGVGDISIETIELDGSNRTLVTDGSYYKRPGMPYRPRWSPHATHVVYYRKGNWGTWYRPKGAMDVWLAEIDGRSDAVLIKDATTIGWRD